MFENVGEKIKNVAVIVFVVGLIIAVIVGLMSLESGGILIGIIGAVLAWLSSLFVYGFGELIESTEENKNISKEILKALTQQTNEEFDDENALPQKRCPKCGMQHDFDYPKCPNCNHDYNV